MNSESLCGWRFYNLTGTASFNAWPTFWWKKIDVSFNWNFLYASLHPLCLIASHRYVRRACFHLLCIISSGSCRQQFHILSWGLKRSSFSQLFLVHQPCTVLVALCKTHWSVSASCNGDPQPGHLGVVSEVLIKTTWTLEIYSSLNHPVIPASLFLCPSPSK